jgi:hypothetical protein
MKFYKIDLVVSRKQLMLYETWNFHDDCLLGYEVTNISEEPIASILRVVYSDNRDPLKHW